jgi:hypothetical protein
MNIFTKRPFALALLATAGVVGAAQAGDTISAGKLAKDAKDFYGQTVSVKSEVDRVVSDHAFTLDEDAIFAGPDVLVLVPQAVTEQLRHDQKVVVTGKVRRYVRTELEKDYSFFTEGKIVKKDYKVDYKTRPVIIADSVMTEDGRDLMKTTAPTSGQ